MRMLTATVENVGDDPIFETREESIYATIRRAGGRLTVPMRVVIAILLDSDRHPTADDLIAAVNERIAGISPSTIYRVLSRLDELEVIEHVHSGTGPAFYQLHESSHVHLVCNTCGTIINIPETAFDELGKSVLAAYKFTIQPRHAALLGQCDDCVTAATHGNHPAAEHRRPHQHQAHSTEPVSSKPRSL